MNTEQVKRLIEAHLTDAQVIIRGDDEVHFEAVVISPDFVGKTRVQQHRLVYAALGESFGNQSIHALALSTHTPEAWQQRSGG